jgi:hypothetical protein
MNQKQITLLLGIFLALVVLTLLLEGPLKGRKKPEEKLLFSEFDPSLVQAIEILQKEKSARLEKVGEKWVILEADTFISADKLDTLRHFADTSAVKRAIQAVDSLSGKVVSNNPDKQDLFQLTPEEGVDVRIFGAGDDVLAHFLIGKVGQDFSSTYIRKEGSKEAILAKGYYRGSTFHPNVKQWRNRRILSFLPLNLARLEITSREGNLLLQKEDGGMWTILEPIQMKADSVKVDQLLRVLSNLMSQDFGDFATPEELGFENPTLQISMEFLDQSPRSLTIGNPKEENNYYVRTSGDETIYVINRTTVERFQTKPEDLITTVEEEKGGDES